MNAKGGFARVWHVESGEPITPWLEHQSSVRSVEFSPDGRRVVTASEDKTARVWDAQTGEPISPPLRHDGDVSGARFSSDGRRILTASADKTARLWDAETGRPAGPPLQHQGAVGSIEISPDGTRLATGSADRIVRLWDSQTGQPISARIFGALTAKFSPDGQRILTHFADRATRTISPFSNILVSEYVRLCCERNSLDSLHEAVLLSPSHGPAFAQLAVKVLEQEENPRRRGEADFLIRRALELAPHDPDVCRISREIQTRQLHLASQSSPIGATQGSETSLDQTRSPELSGQLGSPWARNYHHVRAEPVQQSPWVPPANPDPKRILDEARTDTASGRYAHALAKHVWYHENALKHEPALAGVRLSYALEDWKKLGCLYPTACEKLKQIRDETARNVREQSDCSEAFSDVAAINDSLGESSATRDLFAWLHSTNPSAAKAVFDFAQPALISTREYRLCGEYLEPDSAFQRLVQMFLQTKRLAEGEAPLGKDQMFGPSRKAMNWPLLEMPLRTGNHGLGCASSQSMIAGA